MPDDGPAQLRQIVQGLPFLPGFLHPVFAKQVDTAAVAGGTQTLRRHGFADGQQTNFGRIASATAASRVDTRPHGGKIGADGFRSLGVLINRHHYVIGFRSQLRGREWLNRRLIGGQILTPQSIRFSPLPDNSG